MAKTVQNIIDAALQRNQMNDSAVLAGDPELVGLISRKQQDKYLRVAQAAPDFFGASASFTLTAQDEVVFNQMSPAPAIINRVEINAVGSSSYTTADKVHVVVTDDQAAELAPRMILQSGKLIAVGTDLNGVTSVTVYYSILPVSMNTATSPGSLNMDMPDEFIDTVVSEVAYYLALKDNRNDVEIQVLLKEIEESEALLVRAAELMSRTTDRFAR